MPMVGEVSPEIVLRSTNTILSIAVKNNLKASAKFFRPLITNAFLFLDLALNILL